MQGDVFALPINLSYASAAAAAALDISGGTAAGGAAAAAAAAAATVAATNDDGFGAFELVFDSQCFHCLREHNEHRAVRY